MKVFYHDDLDGQCAASLLYDLKKSAACEFIPMQHDNKPFPMDEIQKDELVYIVDYSISPDMMRELYKITENVCWIDHHKTAIDKYADFEYEIEGLRYNGISGCELTWLYLYAESNPLERDNMPKYIRYIGDRDVWQFQYGDTTRLFCAGLSIQDTHPSCDIWKIVKESTTSTINDGIVISKYRKMTNKAAVDRFAYETEFEGYSAIVCNTNTFTSELFGDKGNEYDLMIVYCWNGNNYTVSMYSEYIDVSKIAVKHGGGGHKGAAGFSVLELPFETTAETH